MPVFTWYLHPGSDGASPNFGAISETAQGASNRADGWTSAKLAAAQMSEFDAGTKQVSGSFSATAKPASFLTGATANALIEGPLTGTFANTAWTFTFALRCTVASAQRGRVRMRVFKSVNIDGSAASELTAATQVGTTVAAALSTTADQTSVVTWSPGTTVVLNNEYLFFVLAWEITTAGGSNSADVQLRTGSTGPAGTRLVTPNFAPAAQSRTMVGLGSAGALGTPTTTVTTPTQTVAVGGVYPSGVYSEAVLSDAPIVYYRFGESSGTVAVDSSGNGRDGTYSGSPTMGEQPGITDGNRAVRFDGVDDKVTIPASVVLPVGSGVTVEWWQYVASADVANTMAFALGAGTGAVDPNRASSHAPWSNNTLYWDWGNSTGPGRIAVIYTAYLNKWTHVCLTFDPVTSEHVITLDGIPVATLINANKPVIEIAGGLFGAGLTYFHKAIVDEFAIYDKALSPTRRLAHYRAASQFGTLRAFLTSGAYSRAVVEDNPNFYWRLGESSGTTAIDTMGTLNGTHYGTIAPGQPGALTASGDTDTSTRYSTVAAGGVTLRTEIPADPRHQTLSNWTIEAWVYQVADWATTGAENAIVTTFYGGGNVALILAVDNTGKLFTGFYTGVWKRTFDTAPKLPINTWLHLVGTYDGTTLCLYRDGALISSAAASGWLPAPNVPLIIGRHWSVTDWGYPARLDEVAVYPRALDAAEVLEHYTLATSSGPTPQTVLVQGIDRGGVTATIVNEFIVGDGHLVGGGATGEVLFGTPVAKLILVAAPGGVSSAQSFGAVITVKGAVARAVTGLGTAQAFGAVTTVITRVPQTVAVTGRGSAQSFGTPVVKASIVKPAGGVPSAQAFGAPVPKSVITRTVTGLGSAQNFGAVSVGGVSAVAVAGKTSAQAFGTVTVLRGVVTRTVVGLGSAQSFGTVTAVSLAFPQTRTVTGLGSAQAFGTVTATAGAAFPQTKPVGGVGSAQQFGSPVSRVGQTVQVPGLPQVVGQQSITGGVVSGDGHVVGGVGSLWGFVTVQTTVTTAVAGLDTAQLFGQVTPTWPQTVSVSSVSSAEAFGRPVVAVILRPEYCNPLTAMSVTCTSLVSPVGSCENVTVTVPASDALTSSVAGTEDLTLVEA